MATAPLGSIERTNQLLAEASKTTGIAAPKFDVKTGAQLPTPPTPNTPGTTSTGVGAPPPTKPAGAVFSAKGAVDFTNNTMVPALQNGMNNITEQNNRNASSDLTHFLPGETADAYNSRVSSVNAAKNGGNPSATPQVSEQDKAATQIANTPEAGNQFIYDQTGQRLEVPLGTPAPAGYTASAPANPTLRGHTVVNQFNAENGTTYQQYSDGSYGVASLDGTFAGTVSADEFNQAKGTSPGEVLKSIATGLASLKNGPLPLTAPQQAQIDGLSASLGQAVAAQEKANANLTGATTVAVNLYGMGNALSGIGLIKGTVDDGIAKIFDLQTKAATAIAAMQEGFDKDNLNQMYTAYQAMTAATKAIDDNITAMHTFAFQQKEHADQEADNLRSFNQTVQQNAITNKREDALAASTLATQALDRAKTLEELKQLKQVDQLTSSLPGGSVMGGDGKPDPALQNRYLQEIAKTNPGLANTIKGIAEYRVSMPASFLRTKAGLALINQVETYDPTFDQSQYATRYNLNNNYSSGAYSKTINALNTATAHIDALATQVKSLGNVGFVPANYVKNFVGGATGVISPAGAKLSIAGVTGEMAAAFKQSGATDQEIKALGVINENSSPKDVQKYIEASSVLLAGKLGALNDTYAATMGRPPTSPLLHPEANKALSDLKNEGYNIAVPGVIYTDVKAYQKYVPDASTKLDAARAMLVANNLPTTPENILQAAQLADQ